jgi:pimeloyl-ACP methyl ester carboxylesterase
VMALEERALRTVADVGILTQRLEMTLTHDRSAEVSKIASPALIVGTRDDATVPFYQSEDLHHAIAGSRLTVMEEGGHYSYRRHWKEWTMIMDAFLREMEAGVP